MAVARNGLNFVLAVASGVGALALWAKVLIAQWPQLMLGSALCGAHSATVGHCPECYVAAGLTALFLVTATSAVQSRQAGFLERTSDDRRAPRC